MNTNRRPALNLFLWIGLIFIGYSCNSPEESDQNVEKWTSSDPLVVNHRVREQKYLHGNLIVNPSFELGKIKRTDSVSQQVNIDGWEIIGNNVKWVTTGADSLSDYPNEVHSGTHGICVHRKQADETEDFGQGVLSDYIKVIPGNYNLNLFLNLKDIQNPKSRLGTKIYDAIDIRILYYDRNKLQIKGEQYSPYFKTTINSSFKGLSFSNFDKIDSTGWIHITGRSQLFPFPDGDLPDNTKFIRIFIGLKGTGTLWTDDVDFEYTQWNLTTYERLSRYFDSTFTKSKLITPQPRKISVRESKIYYRPFKDNAFPIIIVPSSADRITMNSAQKLENKIKELLFKIENIDSTRIPKLIRKAPEANLTDATIVFSIGKTELFDENVNKLPLNAIAEKEQGYFIYTLDALSNVIFIYGNSPEANAYAIQSVIQLFDSKRTLFHNANVIDFPASNKRAVLLTGFEINALNYFYSADNSRFNSVYLPGYSDSIISLGKRIKDGFVQSKFIYYNLSSDDLDKKINKTDAAEISGMSSRIAKYRKEIDGIAFLYNPPFASGINIENLLKQYHSVTKCNTGSKTLNSIVSEAKQQKLLVEVLPGCSNNLYLNKFNGSYNSLDNNIDKDVSFIWSGYGMQSWSMDEADLLYFRSQHNVTPVFIDFTMYSRDQRLNYFANDSISPYKLMTSSLFEAYSNEIVPEIYSNVDKTIIVYGMSNVFDRVRLQTASDFLWNPDSYNPDLSLYKALVAEFGIDATRDLLKFNDLYFKIRSEIILADNQKFKHRHIRRAFLFVDELNALVVKLKGYNRTTSLDEMNNILNGLVNELGIRMKDFERSPFLNIKNYQP